MTCEGHTFEPEAGRSGCAICRRARDREKYRRRAFESRNQLGKHCLRGHLITKSNSKAVQRRDGRVYRVCLTCCTERGNQYGRAKPGAQPDESQIEDFARTRRILELHDAAERAVTWWEREDLKRQAAAL